MAASPNGWMNEELTAGWIEKIWTNFSFTKQMLDWDSFKCHIFDARKVQLKQCNTVMSVIPAGCTKFLQPLDVCINKPFNLFFCKLYDNSSQKGEFVYSFSGKIKAPSQLQKIQWVVQAWKKVSKKVVINSFVVCRITTDDPKKILYLKKCS